jgi:hypothetical protein
MLNLFIFILWYVFKIIIGVIVDVFALIPSLLLVQFFRRLRSREKEISPLNQALYKIKPNLQINDVDQKKIKGKSSLKFPWWCIFIAYGLCLILVGVSIIFLIARGIEFGDEKTQKWLTSILSGFFSSILLTQPLKVKFFCLLFKLIVFVSLKIICLSILFACFCRNANEDKEANEYLDDNQVDLDNDEEYLHSIEVCLVLYTE